MKTSERPRVAVIGGGLSGLSAAHRLVELAAEQNRPVDVTLFEASEWLGGVVGTRTIDGFTVETGADSFITNKPWGVDLCRRLGLGGQLIGTSEQYRRSLVLHDGRPIATPEGFELLVPRKLQALLASPLLTLPGKLRVAEEPFIPPRRDDADESLADFVRRRLGPEALERIIQPLVGGIYTSDPERLSMQATLPRFVVMERDHGSLLRAVWAERSAPADVEPADGIPSGARYGLFATLAGGLRDLLTALEARLQSRATLRLRTPVTALLPTGEGGFSVTTRDDEPRSFEAVVVAVPAFVAADLVADWDAPLADELKAIEHASSAIVVTGHRLADVAHPLDAFGLVIPHVERRRILAVSFLSRKFPGRAPGGHVQLRTFVGGAMQPELLQQDDVSVLTMVREELRQILGIEAEPVIAVVTRYARAMPQYHVGHLRRVAAIEAAVLRHPGLAVAGNAYHGVGIPDCIHSGEQAAERAFRSVMRSSQNDE